MSNELNGPKRLVLNEEQNVFHLKKWCIFVISITA